MHLRDFRVAEMSFLGGGTLGGCSWFLMIDMWIMHHETESIKLKGSQLMSERVMPNNFNEKSLILALFTSLVMSGFV